MVLGNIILQIVLVEWLYQRYSMAKKAIVWRLSSVFTLACSLAFFITVDVVSMLLLTTLGIVLFYIAIIDFLKQRIPNSMLIQLLIVRCVLFLFEAEYLLERIITGLVWLFFLWIVHRLTKQGIGAGDVKLIAVIGLYFGLIHTTFIVLLACLLIALYGVVRVILSNTHWQNSLPMAPFLFIGYVVMISHSVIVFGGI